MKMLGHVHNAKKIFFYLYLFVSVCILFFSLSVCNKKNKKKTIKNLANRPAL